MLDRHRPIAALFATVLSVSGCVHYQAKAVNPADNLRILESRQLTSEGLRAFIETNVGVQPAWPPQAWNLSLLTLAAFYYHPDLDIARSQWDAARAAIVTAGQKPNPTMTVAPLLAPWAAEAPWSFEFSFVFPIETAGKRGHRVTQARSLSEAARARIASAAWQVRSRVRTALVDVWSGRLRLDTAIRQRDLEQAMVGLIDARVRVGEASTVDLNRERLARDRAVVAVRDAERALGDAHARIAGAVGVPAETMEAATIAVDLINQPEQPAPPPLTDLRREALLGRADVQALLAEYAATQAALQLEIAKQYPNVDLGPAYRFEDATNRFGIDLSIPMPLRNRNEGPIAEGEAHRTGAAARLLALQTQVLGEIDRALAAYRMASAARTAADVHLARQREIEAQVVASFTRGESDRVDLTTAALQTVSAEQARLDALVQQRQALALAEDAVQRPLFDASFRPKPAETGRQPTTPQGLK